MDYRKLEFSEFSKARLESFKELLSKKRILPWMESYLGKDHNLIEFMEVSN